MVDESIERTNQLISEYSELLNAISESEFSAKPSPGKWSKKEILGHLIDSATNNHQRFIRAQFEEKPEIYYDEDMWVQYNYYNELSSKQLIHFWTAYNKQLVEIMKRIPAENLLKECKMRDGRYLTLDYLVNDYVVHLQHHLDQIFGSEDF